MAGFFGYKGDDTVESVVKRDNAVDIAKGVGMLFVVAYHLVFRERNGAADQMIQGAVWLFLPLFFALSGYTYRAGVRTPLQNIGRRFQNLLLPSVISCCILLVLGGFYFSKTAFFGWRAWFRDAVHTFLRPELGVKVIDDAGGILFHNISPVWFVWTLWWASMLFFFVADLALKNSVCFGAVTVVLMGVGTALYVFVPPTPWSISLAPVYACMMLLGAYAAKTQIFKRHKLHVVIAIAEAAVCFAVQAFLFKKFGSDQIYAGQLGTAHGWDPVICYLQLVVGGFGMMQLCVAVEGLKLLRPVAFIGKNSLVFLLLHCMFGAVAANILDNPIKTGGQWYISYLKPSVVYKSMFGMLISLCCCAAMVYGLKFIKSDKFKSMVTDEED